MLELDVVGKVVRLDIGAIGPMLAVGTGALLLPLAEVFLERKKSFLYNPLTRERRGIYLGVASLACLVIAGILSAHGFQALLPSEWGMSASPRSFNQTNPMIVMDGVTHFLNLVILFGAAMTVLVSVKYLADVRINYGEYYALLMASVLGMMFLTAATDLLMLFLALELMSIPVYVLAGFKRASLRSNESALKYFLIGSFASGIMLYGMALLYGATGHIELAEIGERFDPSNPLTLLGSALILVGLAFKISSVPFHQWAPDVYEGAPTTVTGFMATTVKVAAFGALIRVISVALAPGSDLMYGALWLLSVLTMTVGNVMAIIQPNIKRMLAYSSIAHAGYILVGIIVGTQDGYASVLFYLLVYTFMTIGAFTVVAVLAKAGEDRERIEDLAGLSVTRPFLAVVMSVCMFSLAGIPGFAGFMGKFQLFRAAIERGTEIGDTSLYWLAILGVLNSAISLAYYLRVPLVMYMKDPDPREQPDAPGFFERVVLLTCVAATILLGIVPQDVFVILGDLNLLDGASQVVRHLAQLP
jgi:NADH-quinone oxidoreductase subunit N